MKKLVLFRDLKSKNLIYLKALLFLFLLMLGVILNLQETSLTLQIISLVVIVWSSARLYYLVFYVIENYVDENYKFSGIFSLLWFWIKR